MRKASKRKRSDAVQTQSEDQGDTAPAVPFKIEYLPVKAGKSGKRTSRQTTSSTPEEPVTSLASLDVPHRVTPQHHWEAMRTYRNFFVDPEELGVDDFVYVNNGDIELGTDLVDLTLDRKFWVARVLEIRAQDSNHVYLRVAWAYWPDELPGGAEGHHGKFELVPSDHLEIIDARAVSGRAEVAHWSEDDGSDRFEDLYWRQTFSARANVLSPLRKHCKCKKYFNPDSRLLGCSNSACGIWLHEECLLDDALAREYARTASPTTDAAFSSASKIKRSGKKPWQGILKGFIAQEANGLWIHIRDMISVGPDIARTKESLANAPLIAANRAACLVCGHKIT
ncbi:MAG: DNA topoisomerase 1 [Chaenotheca gracillima]|nr:MAG: DNA topoisomerase 1 [Chaenotheca gracillima]